MSLIYLYSNTSHLITGHWEYCTVHKRCKFQKVHSALALTTFHHCIINTTSAFWLYCRWKKARNGQNYQLHTN